jgi:hypothetical protein
MISAGNYNWGNQPEAQQDRASELGIRAVRASGVVATAFRCRGSAERSGYDERTLRCECSVPTPECM